MIRFLLIAALVASLVPGHLAAQTVIPLIPSIETTPSDVSRSTAPGRMTSPVVPQRAPEAHSPSFARTALFASVGSFAGLFGGALIGAGLSGGQMTNGAAVMTLSGSVIGASWAGGATSGRGGPAFLGSLLGSVAGIAYVVSAEPSGFGGLISYSVIQGITTAIATSF